MDEALFVHIEYLLGVRINTLRSISGGDISQAFLLETASERFFCKLNEGTEAYKMFLAEKAGLEAISETKTIATPKVLLCEKFEAGGFLLMEYIEPKRASREDMELFGHQLAALHQRPGNGLFGWEGDNYIGSLAQSNKKHDDWTAFYVHERLLPQLGIARNKNLLSAHEIPSEETLLKTCSNLFPEVQPSLLHGDLWGGNYLIAQDGVPYLIDPATYYGHHGVDLAMARLFGGFGNSFYMAHSEHFPKIGGEAARNDLYQLYYLLVHLNLFGRSYFGQVNNILKKYF